MRFVLKSYLRARLRVLPPLLLCATLLLFTCMAYDQPLTPLLYGLFLCAFSLMLLAAVDFSRFSKRLLAVRGQDAQSDSLTFPPPRDALEASYQALCRDLNERALCEHAAAAHAHEELVSYYTLWLHQIKTPIAALRLMQEAGEVDADALGRELFSIERYTAMALEYARLTRTENDLVIERVALEPLVKKCVRNYAELFIGKGLSLTLDPLPLQVHTDEKWLSFILEQLLSNAVKYTSVGGVHIYARGQTLFIEDTGVGIRTQDLPRVFDFGYTGLNGRIDKRASGVGLWMARRASELISVHITLESELGVGTRAVLRLPADAPLIAR